MCIYGGHIRKLCDEEKCDECFRRSFSSDIRSQFWSVKNILPARLVFKNSRLKRIFDCDKCGHEFDIILANVWGGNQWCQYCGGQKLCDKLDCKMCFEKSFASISLVKYWSKENTQDPRMLFKSCIALCKFDCLCGHTFESRLSKITAGDWCPYCCIPLRKLCDNEKCELCFKNSFASSDRAKYWSSENKKTPRQVSLHNAEKYIFNCEVCHESFPSAPSHVYEGKWCPNCKNKTEAKLFIFLQTLFSRNEITKQFKFLELLSEHNRKWPFDFSIPHLMIIIELDGPQHFRQISNWQSPEVAVKRDVIKMKYALTKGYTIIRLLQTDVWDDTNNWKIELIKNLVYNDNPHIIYLTKTYIYSNHISAMTN